MTHEFQVPAPESTTVLRATSGTQIGESSVPNNGET